MCRLIFLLLISWSSSSLAATEPSPGPPVNIAPPPASGFQVSVRLVPEILVTGLPGSELQIEWTSGLGSSAPWNVLTNLTIGETGATTIDLTVGTAGRFYRAVAPLPPPPPPVTAPPDEATPLMLRIPASTFTMGSPLGEKFRSIDETQHSVRIARDYFFGSTEINHAQWTLVRGWGVDNGYTDLPAGRNGWNGDPLGDHPITEVSWFDAVKWCNALSEWTGLVPAYTLDGMVFRQGNDERVRCHWDATGYRLPTEAEWEHACRAGNPTAYFTGQNTRAFCEPEPNLDLAGWYCGNSDANTHPVAAPDKQPNGFGLHDLHGNVLEWCWDWYGSYSTSAVVDPKGPATGSQRASRGGSWSDAAQYCRSASRNRSEPGNRSGNIGFRLCRTAPAEPSPAP
jgi:formylglycine-generating enzyme required for sulfatase activity